MITSVLRWVCVFQVPSVVLTGVAPAMPDVAEGPWLTVTTLISQRIRSSSPRLLALSQYPFPAPLDLLIHWTVRRSFYRTSLSHQAEMEGFLVINLSFSLSLF